MEKELKYERIHRNLNIFWSMMWCFAIALTINQMINEKSNPLYQILLLALSILLLSCLVKWSYGSKRIRMMKKSL